MMVPTQVPTQQKYNMAEVPSRTKDAGHVLPVVYNEKPKISQMGDPAWGQQKNSDWFQQSMMGGGGVHG